MASDWPEEFEKLLRAYLPLLDDDATLTHTVRLPDCGLDSMSTIGLLVDVEEFFGVQLPDEELTPETFSTAGSFWTVVARLRGDVAP